MQMEEQLLHASQFQEHIQQILQAIQQSGVQDALPYILCAILFPIVSLLCYHAGAKKESGTMLSSKLKKKLEELDMGTQIYHVQILNSKRALDKSYYLLIILSFPIFGFAAYQCLLEDYQDILVIVSLSAWLLLLFGTFYYRRYLHKSIEKYTRKIQEDKNQQNTIVQKLLGEMSDKMKKILCDMLSQQIVRESEADKDQIKRQYEGKLKALQIELDFKKEHMQKQQESQLQVIQQQQQQQAQQSLLKQQFQQQQQQFQAGPCKTGMCPKKRKLLKEKLKRNEWFIRNLSEFAWCQVCASNMFEDPSNSFINEQECSENQPSMNLDDSMMNVLSNLTDESNDAGFLKDEKEVFNRLKDQNHNGGQVIRSSCQSDCLNKYFFLCKRIGEKYNQWTELITSFEHKYKQEKRKLKEISNANNGSGSVKLIESANNANLNNQNKLELQ